MRPSLTQKLETALRSRDLIRLTRRFEKGPIRGYVKAIGRQHVLVALVSDRLVYDGFECFRIKDVRSVESDPYRTFAEVALRKRGLRRPRTPKLKMETIRTILETAGMAYYLVTIHREELSPYVCQIGHILSTNRTQVALLEISPHAVWKQRANSYSLKDITRINFGGAYEEALLLVGGESEA